MFNWNDIRVEQEIAQERYEIIVRGRQLAQVRRQKERNDHYARFRDWLGTQVIGLGCQIKVHCQPA
jgi:hypothetical protein